jgi:hypothetical protein
MKPRRHSAKHNSREWLRGILSANDKLPKISEYRPHAVRAF